PTQALPMRSSATLLVVRMVPIREPMRSAMTQAHAETASVHSTPETISCQYCSPPPGSSSKKTPQCMMYVVISVSPLDTKARRGRGLQRNPDESASHREHGEGSAQLLSAPNEKSRTLSQDGPALARSEVPQ